MDKFVLSLFALIALIVVCQGASTGTVKRDAQSAKAFLHRSRRDTAWENNQERMDDIYERNYERNRRPGYRQPQPDPRYDPLYERSSEALETRYDPYESNRESRYDPYEYWWD